ncbi:MAG: hypothetical protein M1825_002026 [Sarcosagium campestre]|nr:MAG: hypothetical protein M1825_002026 [Sarcosagium campestre]
MSSQIPSRSFSFDYHDEPPRPHRQDERHDQSQYLDHQYSQPYRDDRGIISPPPGYTPPPPRVYEERPPSPPSHRIAPGGHPDSAFATLRANRNSEILNAQGRLPVELPSSSDSSYVSVPQPPRHALPPAAPQPNNPQASWTQAPLDHSTSQRSGASATPGADNLGETAAGGGIAGIALGVAAHNERQSGVQALRQMENNGRAGPPGQTGIAEMGRGAPSEGSYETDVHDAYASARPSPSRPLHAAGSYSSTVPLGAFVAPPGQSTPGMGPGSSLGSYPSQDRLTADSGSRFGDTAYNRYSATWDPRASQNALGGIDPNDIEDDGDDGLSHPSGKRRSVLSLGKRPIPGMLPPAGAATAGAAATGGIMGSLGGIFGRGAQEGDVARSNSGTYGPVPGNGLPPGSHGGFDGPDGGMATKSEWIEEQEGGKKRLKWIVGILIAVLVLGAIAGGIVGGILGSRKNSSASKSASTDKGALTSTSSDIKDLMDNKDLHKVFSGMAYTPLNAQYPECLSYPLIQSNVSQDMAVLAQLTNSVRLYGTDCNQTELVIEAIKALQLDDMKIWLGVWQDTNKTTNKRQLDDMYKILDKYGSDPFAGVVVGNEILFREDLTETELISLLKGVRTEFKKRDIKIPIATSDLGDKWDATLAAQVDIIMANIHPFFAGGKVEDAAGWTWDFWHQHVDGLTDQVPNKPKTIISEVGWPSGGGNVCGLESVKCPTKTAGSVAGIDEMNTFMDTFICQSFDNGTDYFWFEAFDEPWKRKFNTKDRALEDKWGLMDTDRKLKPGLKIPDCGGRTVS